MSERSDIRARWINLVVPGAGLVLAGQVWLGVVTGVLFIFLVNFVAAAFLLFPDDVSPRWRGFCSALALGSYLLSQLRLAQHLRRRSARRREQVRREGLIRVQECLAAGQERLALAVLDELAAGDGTDLLLAVRRAQVLTALADAPAARAAWERVARLDRHHIYRGLRVRALERLELRERAAGGAAGQRERGGR